MNEQQPSTPDAPGTPDAPFDDQAQHDDREDTTVDQTAYDADGSGPVEEPDHERVTSSGRHPVSVGHLVMGLAFLCFVGAWALIQTDVVTGEDIRWLLPVPWVVAGAAGLAAVSISGARKHSGR